MRRTAYPRVFDPGGPLLGELVDRHHVRRYALREEPVHRTPYVPTSHQALPRPGPAWAIRTPLDERADIES